MTDVSKPDAARRSALVGVLYQQTGALAKRLEGEVESLGRLEATAEAPRKARRGEAPRPA